MEVIKDVLVSAGALSSKPRTSLSKWQLILSDEEEEKGDREPLTRRAQKRAHWLTKLHSSARGGAVG